LGKAALIGVTHLDINLVHDGVMRAMVKDVLRDGATHGEMQDKFQTFSESLRSDSAGLSKS